MADIDEGQILDLDEIAAPKRDKVIVGGETHFLKSPLDFTLRQYSQLLWLFRENTADMADADRSAHFMEIFRRSFVDCPEDVLEELEQAKKEHLALFCFSRLVSRGETLPPPPVLSRTEEQETSDS